MSEDGIDSRSYPGRLFSTFTNVARYDRAVGKPRVLDALIPSNGAPELTVNVGASSKPVTTTSVSPDELAEAVAERVLLRLGASGRKADYYTTSAVGPHLPGKSRLWMKRNIRKIPGAQKIERDWIISHEDYEQWLRDRDAAQVRRSVKRLAPAKDDAALAEEALRAAGYRPNGRAT